MKACTFAVYVNVDDRGVEMVSLETPNEGSGWRLVELRPVSEGEPLLFMNCHSGMGQVSHALCF